MSRTRCKRCMEFIDTKDVICIHCGTHQASGMHISKVKNNHNSALARQRSRTFKKIFSLTVVVVFMAVVVIAGIKGYFYYQQNNKISLTENTDDKTVTATPSNADAQKTTTSSTIAQTTKNRVTKKSSQNNPERSLDGRKEITLPLQPPIDSLPGYNLGKLGIGGGHGGNRNLSFSFASPDKLGDKLRLMVYNAESMKSTFTLIADLSSSVTENQTLAAFNRPLPKYITPEMKDKIEEGRKIQEKTFGKRVAKFDITDTAPGKNTYYFVALCKPNGSVLFQHSFMYNLPGTNRNMPAGTNIQQQELARLTSGDQEAVYPDFSDRHRELIIRLKDTSTYEVESLKLDGIEYPPAIDDMSEYNRRNPATGREIKLKQTKLHLKYPFACMVEVKLKIDENPITLKFALPPPAPSCSVKIEDKFPTIRWNAIKDINPADYVRLPEIVVNCSRGPMGKFSIKDDPQSCIDIGTPSPRTQYSVVLNNGIIKTMYWTKETGVKSLEYALNYIRNPYQENGVQLDSIENTSRPLRIAFLQSDICYENTGINGRRLMASVADKLIADPGMVLLDQESRKYLIEQNRFKMTESLRAEFKQESADFSVYIRDYSRQDGNGIELWLNKNDQERNKLWWRVADINNQSDDTEKQLAVAADALRAKIMDLSSFTPEKQHTPHDISPETIIMTPLHPLNQAEVVTEFAAISESIMLQLSNNNDKIKIISENDWQMALNERLKNGGNGGGYDFVNKINDIMVTGWLWQEEGQKKYIFKACDVFTGEVLGIKTCEGKINEVSEAISEWLGGLKLAKRTPAAKNIQKGYANYDWINNRGLRQYGEYIHYERESINNSSAYNQPKADVYILAEKNWNDGFKDKAITMMEQEWNGQKPTRAGSMLITYYSGVGRNEEAIALCKILMERDDCPENIVASYNRLRKLGKAGGAKSNSSNDTDFSIYNSRTKAVKNGNTIHTNVTMQGEQLQGKYVIDNDSMDYAGVNYYEENGKKYNEKIPRVQIARKKDDYEQMFFITGDKKYAEWGPNNPCINNRLAYNLPGDLLSQGVKKAEELKTGVWFNALLRQYPAGDDGYIMSLTRFERKYRNHAEKSKNVSKVWVLDEPKTARIKRDYKHTVLVLSSGWNSINPFDEALPTEMQFVRLAYFFRTYKNPQNYHYQTPYDVSYVRAILELKKHADLKIPSFQYYDTDDGQLHSSEIRTGADLINSVVHDINDKMNDNLRDMKLEHLLAIEFMAKRGEARAQKFYRMMMKAQIPQNMDEYRKGGISESFLVFMAGRKNETAKKMLQEYWKNSAPHYEDAADYLYYIADSGDAELTALIAQKMSSGREKKVLRWAPPEVLHTLLSEYRSSLGNDNFHYLTLGSRDKETAKLTLINPNHDDDEFLLQFYGKPKEEAAEDLYREHQSRRNAMDKKDQ